MTQRSPHEAGASRRRRGGFRLRPSRGLFAFTALLVAIVAVAATLIIVQARTKRLTDAEREITNLKLVLAEQAERAFQSVDFLLLAMIEELRANPGKNDPAAINDMLRTRIAEAPQVRGVVVTGPDGLVRYGSQADLVTPIDISDREHFTALRDRAIAGPYIGSPIQTRINGKWAITVSRRLSEPNGEFAGIVGAAVEPEYFSKIYEALDPEHRTIISLARDDGIRLVRHPDPEQLMGRPVPQESPVAARGAAMPSDTFRANSARDGAPRIFSYRYLDNVPIRLLVAMREDIALASWRREAVETALGAAGIAALLCILVGFLARQVARGEALSEKLRASEARFRDFAEATSDWLWEQDEQLRFTWVSEEVGKRSGLAASDHIGHTRRELVKGVSDAEWAGHQADLDARRPFRDLRFPRLGADEQVRFVSTSGKPIFDTEGRFRGYRGTGRDVTHEILAERKLREAKAEAEAASAAKGEFLAVMSHELRTPLNAIIGFSEVIAREVLGPVNNAKYREYAGDIFEAGQHLLNLISNILDMSKIEARKMELHEAEFDVGAAVEGCVRLVQQRAADGGVSLFNWVSPGLPPVRGDEIRIRQVILNVLSNAVKFTPQEGEIVLRSALTEAGGLSITIQDRGIGMSAQEIAVAMQPFGQVESAMNRSYEGTGLGLPLAKALIELHGGSLVIDSAPGEGTKVSIVLPPQRIVATPAADAAD